MGDVAKGIKSFKHGMSSTDEIEEKENPKDNNKSES
jgi:Sec-independent protein translocase protein TatA